MFETLLSPSEIKLYGRVLSALHLLGKTAARGAAGAVKAAYDVVYPPKPSQQQPTAKDVLDAIREYIKSLLDECAKKELLELDAIVAATYVFEAARVIAEDKPVPSGLIAAPAGTPEAVLSAAKDRASDFDYSTQLGANQFLKQQLLADGARLARIYGFSFEGHYYDLPKPALFLVHKQGDALEHGEFGRTTLEAAGVMAREWEFSDSTSTAHNVRKWSYDKGDFSIRLDTESGPFEQILLATMRGASPLASGSDLRTSGSDLRMSGSDLRMSGSDLRNRR
ncbi:MAG TPA: hypothetical protein VMU85_04955 [Stellaceae bacterium]|nr:hypothetical protein [Stellaceae bacterium]